MRHYELTLILNPEMENQTADNFFQQLISSIQQKGGILDKINPPSKTVLAYPIKKKSQGYLCWFSFMIKNDQINKIKEDLSKESNILRLLLTQEEFKKLRPTKQFKPRPLKPQMPKTDQKVEIGELDKKLEEILKE